MPGEVRVVVKMKEVEVVDAYISLVLSGCHVST